MLKNTEEVDFVVNGEGEIVLLELVNALSAKNNDFSTISAFHVGVEVRVLPTIQKIHRQSG